MNPLPIGAGVAIGWAALAALTVIISYFTSDYKANLLGMVIVWTFYKIICDAVAAVAQLRELDKPAQPPPPPPRRGRSSHPPSAW